MTGWIYFPNPKPQCGKCIPLSLRLKYGDIFRSKPKEKRKDSDVSVENQPKNRRKRTDSESSCRSDTSHVSASSRISSLGDRLLHISGASEGVIGYRTIVQRNIVEKEPLSNAPWTNPHQHRRQRSLPELPAPTQTEFNSSYLEVPVDIPTKRPTEDRLKILNNELSNFDATKANPIKQIRTDRSFQEPGR